MSVTSRRRPTTRRYRGRDRRATGSTSNRIVGWGLVAIAVAMSLVNTSDMISDLKDWHGATAPQFVGPFIKQLGTTLLGAFGGKMIPTVK